MNLTLFPISYQYVLNFLIIYNRILSLRLYGTIMLGVIFLNAIYSEIFLVHLLSCVQLSATSWTTTHQAPLSFTISWRFHKLMSTESMMLSNHLSSSVVPFSSVLHLSQHQDLFRNINLYSNCS